MVCVSLKARPCACDVPVAGAERGPGITVRQTGRLDPMHLLDSCT